MLKSLYAYKSTHTRTLSFQPNEKFLEVGISTDPNWLNVISEKGIVGYIPKNYVRSNNVHPNEMLEIIDSCIQGIHNSASKRGGNYDSIEHEALQELVEKRQQFHSKVSPSSHPSKRPAPPPPNIFVSRETDERRSLKINNDQKSTHPVPSCLDSANKAEREDSGIEVTTNLNENCSSLDEDVSNGENSVGTKPSYAILEESKSYTIAEIDQLVSSIPDSYYRHLVEDIRTKTNVSFSVSHQVALLIFQSLESTFPSLEPLFQAILNEKDVKKATINTPLANDWEQSSDGRDLVAILEKLRQCKDDDQQRSWALHEDEHIIKNLLNDLIDILTNGDTNVCNSVLVLEDHRPLLTIVQYYQMETRWILRKLLLQVFATVCEMSKIHISYLSSSILPLELSRVLLHTKSSEEELQYSALILGMVLSMGDVLPYTHFSIMNEIFIEEILNGVESYSEDTETETISELYMTLILAFNLQHHVTPNQNEHKYAKIGSENAVMKVLSRKKNTKHFIERLLLLFNREENPVHMFNHEPQPAHSVLCMMGDLFSFPKTAQFLYTNDEKVVCDIILRQLTDLPSEDKRRCDYLHLLEGVVTLGRWKEHHHRGKELRSRLKAISLQKEFPSDLDIAIRILNLMADQ